MRAKRRTWAVLMAVAALTAMALLAPVFERSAVAGDGGALERVLSGVQRRYDGTGSLKASFTQEVRSTAMGTSEKGAGTVYFKRPGLMRWDYDNGEKVLGNGRLVWVFQPDLGQVIEEEMDMEAPNIAMDFLSGVGSVRRDFEVSLVTVPADKRGRAAYRLKLAPKKEIPGVTWLFMDVSRSFEIVRTVIHDPYGNVTTVELHGAIAGVALDEAFFDVKIFGNARIVKP